MPMLDDRAATRRLLDRLGFGARSDEMASAQQRGFDATLTALLNPGDDAGADATPPPDLPYIDVADPSLSESAKQDRYEQLYTQQQQLSRWWLARMVATRTPLRERLAWFWHGHFATSFSGVADPRFMLKQSETFRRLGFGPFPELAKALIVDPALLIWLNGNQNQKSAPNENLGREFLELFALGVGNYSEADVKDAARALTGWTVDTPSVTARLDPTKHDADPKTVLGTTANLDAPGLADLVTGTDTSARFVTGRLWFRMVSATPPDAATATVLATGHRRDVRTALGALARSDGFRDPANAMVKAPVEWAAGVLRALNVPVADLPEDKANGVLNLLTQLGQVPFRPPNVGGWSAGPSWLTPLAGLQRIRLVQSVVDVGRLPAAPVGAQARVEWARQLFSVPTWSPRTANALTAAADDPAPMLAVAAASPEVVVSA